MQQIIRSEPERKGHVLHSVLAVAPFMRKKMKNIKVRKLLRTCALLAGVLSVSQVLAIDGSLHVKKESKQPDLEVSWPATKTQPAVTFRIPREYLHAGTTWVEKDGSVKSFAVEFELPGPKPVQARPWLKGKKGTPEYEAFMKTWGGRFSMDVERSTSGGYSTRQWMRRSASTSSVIMRDGFFAGLERYSTRNCYNDSYLKINTDARKFLAGKPEDDMSPLNCRFNRRSAYLVSPHHITADDEGVAMNCMTTGCKLYLNAEGRRVSMGIAHKDIENWEEISSAVRKLVRSFVAK